MMWIGISSDKVNFERVETHQSLDEHPNLHFGATRSGSPMRGNQNAQAGLCVGHSGPERASRPPITALVHETHVIYH
jgi:hypothetical protein